MAEKGCSCAAHLKKYPTHLLDCRSRQYYFQRRHDTAIDLVIGLMKAVHPDALVRREVGRRTMKRGERVPAGTAMQRPRNHCVQIWLWLCFLERHSPSMSLS